MSKTHRRAISYFALICLLVGPRFAAAQPPDAEKNTDAEKKTGVQAITSLPEIATGIHTAMQSRKYQDAVAEIDRQLSKDDAPEDYLLYLKAIALTEARQFDEALSTFQRLETDHPDSKWISRSKFGRANVFVLRRQYIDAGKIYQQEAGRLLSRGRKDELAKIYLEFADRYFEGVPARDPSQNRKPDFKQALTYYSEVAKLGPTTALLQTVEFRIARCHQQLGAHDKAIAAFESFLKKYGPEKPEKDRAPELLAAQAKFNLGAVELSAGKRTQARKTWQDFLTEWNEQEDAEIAALVANAELRIAHTYGLPKPASIGELELAVTAAQSFLRNHPDHELAPQAELEIAQGYSNHSRHAQAIDRLLALIENPAYSESKQIPVARRMLGQAHLTQRRFDDAITAWKDFLDQHPTDSQWSNVQKMIVDAEYARAAYARSIKDYDQARELWQTFLNKYPLDSRAPAVLIAFGEMKHAQAADLHAKRVTAALQQGQSPQSVKLNDSCEKLFLEAIADWRRVVNKYPGHASASQAGFLVGKTLEDRLGQLKEALAAYKEVKGRYQSQAQKRIAKLTAPQLEIMTERKFRSNEKPRIKLTTRNLESVTVKTYRIDMTDYFRKMHLASGVETLDIALIDPDQQFDHQVQDYQQYRLLHGDVEIPIADAGVTAVTVSSEKLEATTMVVVSDLDVIVKSSRNELFLFAQNMRTGKPQPGTSVLISDGSEVFAEELTGEDGVLQKSYGQLKSVGDLRVFAVHEGHVASTVNDLNGLDFAVGLSPRGYLFTDRPAYRSGQLVNIKGIVRWVAGDRFTFTPGTKFHLDVYDSRGRQLHHSDVKLSGFGTVNDHLVLPESAPQGNYRIHLHRTSSGPDDKVGAQSFETKFTVTQYKLEPIEIQVDLEKDVYFRGEQVKGEISIAYYYGTPLSGETVQYKFGGDGELITAKTDDKGKVSVSFDTQRFSESQTIALNVSYPERGLNQSKKVYLATRGFEVTASTVRDVFINGESFEALFQVSDPAGEPVETDLKVELFQRTNVNGQLGEKLIETHEGETTSDSGQYSQTLVVDAGGMYIVRATGVDQFGNQVSGQALVRISGDKDSVRLRILADRHSFDVGQTAKVKLHWRGNADTKVAGAAKSPPPLALVTFEGAKVLDHKLVELKPGENVLSFPVQSDFAPNFFLSVAVMQQSQFHAATSPFRVSQRLRLKLIADKTELRPGEDLLLAVEATDVQGKPVQAELALAMVQTNLLNIFRDAQGVIDQFFSEGTRTASVRQATSCTFQYRPTTRGVSEFLLAEAERVATLRREARALSRLGRGGNRARPGDNNGDGVIDSNDIVDAENLYDDLIVSGVASGGVTQHTMRNSGRARVVPQVRYRTEFVDGKQIQVPYTEQVTQSYTVQVPYTEQGRQSAVDAFTFEGRTVQLPNFAFQQEAGQQIVGDFAVQQQQLAVPQPAPGQYGAQRGEGVQQRFAIPAYASANYAGTQYGRAYGSQSQQAEVYYENSTNQTYFRQLGSLNALTADGEFKSLRTRGEDELWQLVSLKGMQLFPALAHAETAFWNPTIVTDQDGKATVTIPMPERSTAWRIRGKGINVKTLSGQTEIDLITKKSLFGEMKLPTALTVGDKASIPVEIHDSIDGSKAIEVKLKVTLGEQSTEQSKSIDAQGPGIHKIAFEIDAATAGDAEFRLQVSTKNETDSTTEKVTVRPFGFPVFATASGTSAQSTVSLIQFEKNLNAQDPELEIVIGSNVNRALLQSVLDSGQVRLLRCGLPTGGPQERGISDILGGVAMLRFIGSTRNADTPEAQALVSRISGAVAQLVSAQLDDGGWSRTGRDAKGAPDSLLSSRVMWALSVARKAGFVVAQDRFRKGQAYLQSAFSKADQSDLERQAIVLHGMAVSDCGDFALANRLYRERNRLSNSGLTHLALAMGALKHAEMAEDLLDLVRFSDAAEAGRNRGRVPPWMASEIEMRALYLLALQEIRPRDDDTNKQAKWLMAARVGSRWPIEKANGPAIAALTLWEKGRQGNTERANGKYKLTISVNDRELETLTIDPAKDGSKKISVPRELIHNGKPQRLEFKLDGRGQFSYSAVMTGFVAAEQLTATTKDWKVDRRYEPAKQMFDGRPVPRGFGVVSGSYRSFTNLLTQLPVGQRGEVTLSPRRYYSSSTTQYHYLVVTDPIPAGCTVLEDSVQGTFERYEIQPGQITFYLGNRRSLGDLRYTLLGYVPGDYRTPQTILRNFYDPSRFAISKVKPLQVLNSDQQSVDEYRLTPDELYHLGQKYFEKQDYRQAHKHLTKLFDNWRLDTDKYKNSAQSLFKSSLALGNHSDIVKYFEILKERFPDVELSFEEILDVANAYREIGEYERSYLVYRATVEGSFERESQVAGFLNARGQFLRSVQAMEQLLKDYPAESYVATATHALAQEVYRRAPSAAEDEKLKKAGVTRVELINASVEMLDHLVTTWPEDPANDQASFALATALIDLDQYDGAIKRCQRYAETYAGSRLLDSFWYIIGYCHFELQQHDQALQMCRKVAETKFPVPETGGSRVADNKWEAVYIMGQIYHSLGKAADAISEYTRVEERFADAAEAIKFFSRKDIALDEVTTIKPNQDKQTKIKFRNIAEAAIKVYRIDLMKFGLMQRSLDRITAINLAGIKPYHEETIRLGDGKDFRDREKTITLPLKEEGAYLLVCRGENKYASGLILVSPLKLLVSEDITSGRVRVSVKDVDDDKFVNDVHVKAIGTGNEDFQSGETDLRGLFVADDVQGICTVIAVSDKNRYAFYRGEAALQGVLPESEPDAADAPQQQAAQQAEESAEVAPKPSGKAILRSNIYGTNGKLQELQKDNYDGLLNNDRKGVKSKEAY